MNIAVKRREFLSMVEAGKAMVVSKHFLWK
jgi:hypothetical protein